MRVAKALSAGSWNPLSHTTLHHRVPNSDRELPPARIEAYSLWRVNLVQQLIGIEFELQPLEIFAGLFRPYPREFFLSSRSCSGLFISILLHFIFPKLH